MVMADYECPWCPETRDDDDVGHNQTALSALAQHVYHRSDHPEISTSKARARILEYNGEMDGGSDTDDEDGEGGSSPARSKWSGEGVDPLLTMPDWDSDAKPRCPTCRTRMSAMTEGTRIRGEYDGQEIQYESDGDDYRCHDCGTMLTGAGQTVTEVTTL